MNLSLETHNIQAGAILEHSLIQSLDKLESCFFLSQSKNDEKLQQDKRFKTSGQVEHHML